MSGRPVRGTIKRYYSGCTLAYASYGKEGLSSVRASSSQRLLMALYVTFRRSGIWTLLEVKPTSGEALGCVGPTRLTHPEHCVASPRTCEEAGLTLTVYELIAQKMVRC